MRGAEKALLKEIAKGLVFVLGCILLLAGVVSMLNTASGHGTTWSGLSLSVLGMIVMWGPMSIERRPKPISAEARKELEKRELAEIKDKLSFHEQFCEDCGQRLVKWSAQRGFDAATGEPAMDNVFACPGWDSKNNYSFTHGPQRTCGKPLVTSYAIAFTHGHDITQPSVLCKACLVEMYRDGIIDRVAYASLMEKAS